MKLEVLADDKRESHLVVTNDGRVTAPAGPDDLAEAIQPADLNGLYVERSIREGNICSAILFRLARRTACSCGP